MKIASIKYFHDKIPSFTVFFKHVYILELIWITEPLVSSQSFLKHLKKKPIKHGLSNMFILNFRWAKFQSSVSLLLNTNYKVYVFAKHLSCLFANDSW